MKGSELQEKLDSISREIRDSGLILACENIARTLGIRKQPEFLGPTEYCFENRILELVYSEDGSPGNGYLNVSSEKKTVFEARERTYQIDDISREKNLPVVETDTGDFQIEVYLPKQGGKWKEEICRLNPEIIKRESNEKEKAKQLRNSSEVAQEVLSDLKERFEI